MDLGAGVMTEVGVVDVELACVVEMDKLVGEGVL